MGVQTLNVITGANDPVHKRVEGVPQIRVRIVNAENRDALGNKSAAVDHRGGDDVYWRAIVGNESTTAIRVCFVKGLRCHPCFDHAVEQPAEQIFSVDQTTY